MGDDRVVASADTYAIAEYGTRRQVFKGYELPSGWKLEQPEKEPASPKPPKRAVSKKRRP